MPDGRNPIDVEIGRRIRKRRADLGMSQHDLAKRLGADDQQVQNYETGEDRVSAFDLMIICRALNLGVEEMFSPPLEKQRAQRGH